MLKGKTAQLLGVVILSSLSLSACTTGATPQASVNKGTVQLEAIRVGTPETVFKEAMITFVQDPLGSSYGKNQYLSRLPDANGGQYVIQAKNDVCYEVDVVHQGKSVPKEVALETMKRLLPANVKADQPLIDKSTMKASTPVETYIFDTNYIGQIFYADKNAKDVKVVSMTRVPKPI